MATKKPFPTLALTSPLTHGKVVKEAQFLLNQNRHGKDFYEGKSDGVYGTLAASASREAKHFLGYPSDKINGLFGSILRAYLVPVDHPDFKKLPLPYRIRSRKRSTEAAKKAQMGRDVLTFANSWDGYREDPPGSNRTMFGKWYGLDGYAWCAMFVSYCLSKQGFYFKQAYVPYIVENARRNRDKTFITTNPQPGHMVCFDWDYDYTYDHIGFFSHWINKPAGVFATVEGNTSGDNTGSQSNGGGVHKRIDRSTKSARVAFVGWRP
jgi:hypothetical protein